MIEVRKRWKERRRKRRTNFNLSYLSFKEVEVREARDWPGFVAVDPLDRLNNYYDNNEEEKKTP